MQTTAVPLRPKHVRTTIALAPEARAVLQRAIDTYALATLVLAFTLALVASGCGVTVKEYGRALAHDPAYADKAKRVSEATRDLSEWLPELVPVLREKLQGSMPKLAYHPPCTLQHGQQLRGGVETLMTALGFDLKPAANEPLGVHPVDQT
jgi:glycolate oxidase iron-sulfur subunit